MQIDESDFRSFITIKRNLATQSVRHCVIRIKVLNRWFVDKELTKENVERFFSELKAKGLKNNSLNTYFFVFHQLREYCKDRGLSANFLDGFQSFKKTKPDIVIFTQEEIEKILNTTLKYGTFHGKDSSFLDFRYRTLTSFLAFTGCRYAEAGELRIRHLDISAGRATFVNTKNNENRSAYFTEPLKSNLKKLIEGRDSNDFVFRNAVEKKIHVTDYSYDLKKRASKAGVTKRVHPHLFRHSYATILLTVGIPITEVASLLGHRDIQTTFSTYMHLADKTLQNAAMRHPLVRKNVDPHEIIKNVKDTIGNLHLESDNRFSYSLVEKENRIFFEVAIKTE